MMTSNHVSIKSHHAWLLQLMSTPTREKFRGHTISGSKVTGGGFRSPLTCGLAGSLQKPGLNRFCKISKFDPTDNNRRWEVQKLLHGWYKVLYCIWKKYFGWPNQPSSGLDVIKLHKWHNSIIYWRMSQYIFRNLKGVAEITYTR